MQENPWQKRFERERAAKKEAEALLEQKSLELYEANLSLEAKVTQRTQELQEALEAIKLAQKAKDTFLASMSHELRTPLNAIIGFSQILHMQSDVPEKIKPFIEKINIAGNNLLRLINTILNFSKIESEDMQLSLQTVSLKAFIEEVTVLIEPQVKEKQITLTIDTDESVASIDKQLFSQALLNILSNAVKFTHTNGSISIKAKQNDQLLFLEVCDNGVGIKQEDQEELFKPFKQVKNEYQAKVSGTGLGLYLTRKIIELHGGTITLKSELGKGSCFTILI